MNISERLSQIEFQLLSEPNEVNASFSGTNSYYHYCDVYGGRASYCVCLHTIAAVGAGRITLSTGCQDAIMKKTCPALFMRAKEIKEGRALYFLDRNKFTTLRDEAYDEFYNKTPYGFGKPKAQSAALKGKWVEDKMDFSHVEKSASENSAKVPKKQNASNGLLDVDVSASNDDALRNAINTKIEELNNE